MTLSYNGTALDTLGVIQILSQNTTRESAAYPLRERQTLRVRLTAFEGQLADNRTQMQAVRTALKTQSGRLLWQDAAGVTLLDRQVMVADDSEPETEKSIQATYEKQIEFSFWFYNVDLAGVAITASFQRTGGALVSLGQLDDWREGHVNTYVDDLHPNRKRAERQLQCAGHWMGDPNLDLATRRAALLALKKQMLDELQQGGDGVLTYDQGYQVRVRDFNAKVDDAAHFITWSLNATVTLYPDEDAYAFAEFTLTRRSGVHGLATVILSGRVEAKTRELALTRIALFRQAVQPTGYLLTDSETEDRRTSTNSGTAAGGDGEIFVGLNFTDTYEKASQAVSFQRPAAAKIDLGTVTNSRHSIRTELLKETADARKLTELTLTATGRIKTTPDKALDVLQTIRQQLTNGCNGLLAYGDFSRNVRVREFTADPHPDMNSIVWNLTATATLYPDEAAYTLSEYTVTSRSGVKAISVTTIAGRIDACTLTLALAKLESLRQALAPSGYVLTDESTEQRSAASNSGTITHGDGAVFVGVTFNLTYEQASAPAQWTRTGGTVQSLGTVEGWRENYTSGLMDDLKSQVRRTGGMIAASGRIDCPAGDAVEAAAAIRAEIAEGISGLLERGDFAGVVKVVEFSAEEHPQLKAVHWSLNGQFTVWPNEANYTLCEWRVSERERPEEGFKTCLISGRIGAPTEDIARAKLETLRASLAPDGYTLVDYDATVQTDETADAARTDAAFMELAFTLQYRAITGNVVHYSLRTDTNDDARDGFNHIVYSGTVQAAAASVDTAWTVAAAKAAELGDNKLPFKLNGHVTLVDKLDQTTQGDKHVIVEFSYEYRATGAHVFMELQAELTRDTFGVNAETVSGFIKAPTLAAALVKYEAEVKPLYAGSQLLGERRPTRSSANVDGAALEGRFDFSFTVHVAKGETETAIVARIESRSNFLTLEKMSNVSGHVVALDEPTATAYLTAYLAGLALGNQVDYQASASTQTARKLGGSADLAAFLRLEFSVTYAAKLTGITGVLECALTEEKVYSATRLVEQPLPDAVSVVQACGTTMGTVTISGTVTACTEAAANLFVQRARNMLSAAATRLELPPRVATSYEFVQRTDGIARGTGANPRVFRKSFTFAEWLPSLPYGS